MFSAKNIVLLTEINGFFDASLLHNYMDVISFDDVAEGIEQSRTDGKGLNESHAKGCKN